MTSAMIDFQDLIEKSTDGDWLREMIGFAAERLMGLEVEGLPACRPERPKVGPAMPDLRRDAAAGGEAETFWSGFLRTLNRRGLTGVKLVISDAHEGLKAASAKVLGVPPGNAVGSTSCATRSPMLTRVSAR